jgi:hypothetical protein
MAAVGLYYQMSKDEIERLVGALRQDVSEIGAKERCISINFPES